MPSSLTLSVPVPITKDGRPRPSSPTTLLPIVGQIANIKESRPRPAAPITPLPIIETVRPTARQSRRSACPSVVQASIKDARPSIHIVNARPSIEARARTLTPPILADPAVSPTKAQRPAAPSTFRPRLKVRVSSTSAPPLAPDPPQRNTTTAAALRMQHVRAASDTYRPTAPRAQVTRYAHSDEGAVASSSSSGSHTHQPASPRSSRQPGRLAARAELDDRFDDFMQDKRGRAVSRPRDLVPVRRSGSRERVPRRNEQGSISPGRASGGRERNRNENDRVVISRHKNPSFLFF